MIVFHMDFWNNIGYNKLNKCNVAKNEVER